MAHQHHHHDHSHAYGHAGHSHAPDTFGFAFAAGVALNTLFVAAEVIFGYAANSLALIWEIQPNVYKPAGDRNRNIAKIYRRHRNWHIITLVAALEWLRAKHFRTYLVRGEALAVTHEVNPQKPLSEAIAALHNRTIANVIAGLNMKLIPAGRDDELLLLDSDVMNVGLSNHVARYGAADAIWRAE